jgi:hypothetical protein
MKRWLVDLQYGKVKLAAFQHYKRAEYLPYGAYPEVAFVLAVDELGAFVRAKQLIEEQTNA